jgi:hypothetical protein
MTLAQNAAFQAGSGVTPSTLLVAIGINRVIVIDFSRREGSMTPTPLISFYGQMSISADYFMIGPAAQFLQDM